MKGIEKSLMTGSELLFTLLKTHTDSGRELFSNRQWMTNYKKNILVYAKVCMLRRKQNICSKKSEHSHFLPGHSC